MEHEGTEIWTRKVKIEIAIAAWYSITQSPFNKEEGREWGHEEIQVHCLVKHSVRRMESSNYSGDK